MNMIPLSLGQGFKISRPASCTRANDTRRALNLVDHALRTNNTADRADAVVALKSTMTFIREGAK